MKKIVLRPTKENATPLVVRALEQLCQSGGGTLAFETGEYHFYEEGTRREFMAVSNNSACDKAMAFPILLKLLKILMLSNTLLFAACTVITFGVFAVVYGAVYRLTAKTYYKIVH